MKRTTVFRLVTALLLVCLTAAGLFFAPDTASAEEEPLTVDNGIPVVYLNVDELQGTIEDMIASPDHSAYCYGTITISVPEGFHYSDFPDLTCESLEGMEMSMRGRGNSTWIKGEKKPFKIKLDKKTDVLGLGKNKHWVLVANDFDASLIKDRITAWLGDQMGFPFTPRGVPVDLVLTGQNYGSKYLGSYYLSENVRVDDGRVEIEELKEDDTDPAVITGGYLLQNAVQLRDGSPDRFFTKRGVEWGTHTPSFDTEADQLTLGASGEGEDGEEPFSDTELGDAYKNNAQQDYIRNYMQEVEDVLFRGDTSYRELFDMELAAKYWLIQEVTLNADAFATGSTYIYKDRDGDGTARLCWGPLWDFDYAWNHRETAEGLPAGHKWTKAMLYDRGEGGFVEELYKYWPTLRSAMLELIADGGVIDGYFAETKASAEADALIFRQGEDFDYAEAVEELKDWIRERLAWLDENFSMVDELVHRITMMAGDEVYDLDFIGLDEPFRPEEHTAELEGYYFVGWEDEDGNPIRDSYFVDKDTTVIGRFIPDDEVTHATDIAFSKDCDCIRFNPFFSTYTIQYEIIPVDAVDRYHTWTSSDEALMWIEQNGLVKIHGTGTCTFTVTLSNGRSRTFTLTVTDGEITYAETMFPDQETIFLTVGEESPCSVSTTPSPAKLSWYEYESEDPGVAEIVSDLGVIRAVAPGQTRVRVTAGTTGDTVLETYVTVIVSEAAYTVTEDSPSAWTKGGGEGITLTVKRSPADETCFSHFTGVKIDGAPLEADKDYTAAPGSTVVTIAAGALEKLDAGTHTVTVTFDDGQAETALKITAAGEDSPPTGDRMSPAWLILMGAGWAGLVAARMYWKRKGEQ